LAQDKPDPTVINAGKDDFEWQCAPCHGADGTGNGPMAKQLIKAPTNLTGIAKTNDGTFPFWRVYRIISGKKEVPGHETFQMPEYWKRFTGAEYAFGFLPPHVRVLMLTHYLETIQQE
jgi:mono/diheme cytochrome c family protein